MRIAFFAPMKAPDHPVPSGDRAMARALVAALAAGGHAVETVSTLRTWCAAPEPAAMRAVEAAVEREADRLSAAWAMSGAPDLWFTYHSYYRAPDLLGPELARRFGLAYGLAEASHAAKRAEGPWARWHAASEVAIRAAAVHLCFTDRDAAGLATLVAPERIVKLPPFLSRIAWVVPRNSASCPSEGEQDGVGETTPSCLAADSPVPMGARAKRDAPGRAEPVRLLTVAMMRPAKVCSYAILAAALLELPADLDWRLAVAGDGPSRAAVEAAFAALPPERVTWHGALDATGLSALQASSDLFVWPGFREPFGVAYLEASAAGLPVLAMASGGVASVVEHGRTGLLVPEGDVSAYADALRQLVGDADLRRRLGREGRRMAIEERTLARAARILDAALRRAIAAPAA